MSKLQFFFGVSLGLLANIHALKSKHITKARILLPDTNAGRM